MIYASVVISSIALGAVATKYIEEYDMLKIMMILPATAIVLAAIVSK